MDYLKFEDIQINRRKYYTADFNLSCNSNNQNHTHDFYEVITITNGEFIEYNNGQRYLLKKGMAHFIRPTDRHYLVTSKTEHNTIRNIVFEQSFFETCLKEANLALTDQLFEPFHLNQHSFEQFVNKIHLLDQINNPELMNETIVKSIFYDFMLSLTFWGREADTIPKWLRNCHTQMQKEEHLTEGLPRLIALSGKSQAHLTRAFKKYYHLTPTDFINNLKIQKAVSLLCLTDKRILEIALECGFENLSYFNRLFKEKYSTTPRQYRDIHKNIF